MADTQIQTRKSKSSIYRSSHSYCLLVLRVKQKGSRNNTEKSVLLVTTFQNMIHNKWGTYCGSLVRRGLCLGRVGAAVLVLNCHWVEQLDGNALVGLLEGAYQISDFPEQAFLLTGGRLQNQHKHRLVSHYWTIKTSIPLKLQTAHWFRKSYLNAQSFSSSTKMNGL